MTFLASTVVAVIVTGMVGALLLRMVPRRTDPAVSFELESELPPQRVVALLQDPLAEAWATGGCDAQVLEAGRSRNADERFQLRTLRFVSRWTDHVMVEWIVVEGRRIQSTAIGPWLRIDAQVEIDAGRDGGSTIRYRSTRERHPLVVPEPHPDVVRAGWSVALERFAAMPTDDVVRSELRRRLVRGTLRRRTLVAGWTALAAVIVHRDAAAALATAAIVLLAIEAVRVVGNRARIRRARRHVAAEFGS